nr:malate dehydrogenase [Crypthecodinium cohnii]
MAPEKRVDPEDGCEYTYDEMAAYYQGKYKKKAIAAYWETCTVAKKSKKGKKAEAKPEPKAKGKAKAKAKAKAEPKAKAKAKAKAKKEPKPAGNFKVCVCGGAGGIGQPLSLLMSMDPNVKELCIFDLNVAMVPPAGVAADLSHLERKAAVKGYVMEVGKKPIDFLEECLTGCDLVLVPAGMPRKPGMTRDDLFKTNADIAKGIVEACAKFCPKAVLGMIVNPVNSVVPAMAELYKKKGLDPMKIIGITTLDVVRANKFVGTITGKNPNYINVPVIGGHAGTTIMPVFSQDKVAATIDAEKIPDLDKHVQDAGTEVVEAKGGKGSATLSMAYAGARFGKAVLAGLAGKRRVECAYCKSDVTDLPYFAQKVAFGEGGITKVFPLGDLNEYEKKRLEEAKTQLKTEIETGLKYAEGTELAE